MQSTPEYVAEYEALDRGAGVVDVSDRTRLELRGPDAAALLHSFCTNDVKRLAVGAGCEAFVTSPQGKTLGHVLISRLADRFLLDTSPGQGAVLMAHFNKYVIGEDVQFVDRTAEWCGLLVAGGQSPRLLADLIQAEVPAQAGSVVKGLVGGHEVFIVRTDYAGPGSFFVHGARADQATLVEELQKAGAIRGQTAAWEARRIEAGFPAFGRDITDENLPQEVARDAQAISFQKGCYLGQETVARIDALGHVNRLLVGLRFETADPPPPGTALQLGGKDVGRVTSAAFSPRAGAAVALAYLQRIHSKSGAVLASAAGSATVTSLPMHLA